MIDKGAIITAPLAYMAVGSCRLLFIFANFYLLSVKQTCHQTIEKQTCFCYNILCIVMYNPLLCSFGFHGSFGGFMSKQKLTKEEIL